MNACVVHSDVFLIHNCFWNQQTCSFLSDDHLAELLLWWLVTNLIPTTNISVVVPCGQKEGQSHHMATIWDSVSMQLETLPNGPLQQGTGKLRCEMSSAMTFMTIKCTTDVALVVAIL